MAVMEDARVWIGGGVGAAVVLLAGGWFLVVGPEMATVPAQQATAADAQTANDILVGKVSLLKAQDKDKSALIAGLRTARNELPIYADLPTFINQLSEHALLAKVTVTSLAVGGVTVIASPVATTAASTDTGATAAATPSPTPSATAASATTDTTATTVAALTSASAAGQLFQIQLTVITRGSLTDQRTFLGEVQRPGLRAALVTSTQLSPDQASESSSIAEQADLTTSLNIFVAPQTPAVATALGKQLGIRLSR